MRSWDARDERRALDGDLDDRARDSPLASMKARSRWSGAHTLARRAEGLVSPIAVCGWLVHPSDHSVVASRRSWMTRETLPVFDRHARAPPQSPLRPGRLLRTVTQCERVGL